MRYQEKMGMSSVGLMGYQGDHHARNGKVWASAQQDMSWATDVMN